MNHPLYNKTFFKVLGPGSVDAAKAILPIIIELYDPQTAIDIGCGNGEFLYVCESLGIVDLLMGVDGPWIKPSEMLIEIDRHSSHFSEVDLNTLTDEELNEYALVFRKNPAQRYDLAICVEVAEHLFVETAPLLVRLLTVCSDLILFSAATPGQGGPGHFNEQPLSYWQELFAEHGYACLDIIRPKIKRANIPAWYKENCVVFKKLK